MIPAPRVLVVGLGSHHGDDQAGWWIVEQLLSTCGELRHVDVRRALLPLDIVDWLDGVDTLHVCDACDATTSSQAYHRFLWDDGCLQTIAESDDAKVSRIETATPFRNRSSHDFGIVDVLRLAAALNRLPGSVNLWAAQGTDFRPGAILSESTRSAAAAMVTQICRELFATESSFG